MTTLALSPTTSQNLQREAEAHPWFSFQPGKSPRQPRQDAVMLHEGGTGRPPWAKMDAWTHPPHCR